MEKVSFSWNLVFKCNYRCPYCWFDGKWQEMEKMNRCLPVDELVRYWANIHKRYGMVSIEILGGEPFLYPNFIELIKELSNIHSISITTNLSCDISRFVKDVNASNVRICTSFHPYFADFTSFLKKALLLKECKFSDSVSYVAYPPQISLINYYKEKFAEENLNFSIMSFWGKYRGVDYPAGYTEEEKEIINLYLNERAGEKLQLVPKKFKGILCRAGQTYAVIHPDGTTVRCGGTNSVREIRIGNFFDDNFKLLDNTLPCSSEHCPCNEWAFLLVDKDNKKVKRERG